MTVISRWRLILSAVLTILIASFAYTQTPKNNHTEVSRSEYEIFSAFIARVFVGKAGTERVPFPVSQIVIVDRTEYDESEIEEDMSWKEVSKSLREQVPSLQLATTDNFREANLRQAALQQRFRLPLPYQLVAGSTLDSIIHDIADWSQYYKHYPGAQGFLTLSRVGFSPHGDQAMFYVTNHCGGKCATGSFVVAQKRDAGWAVVKEMIFWVS